MHRRQFVLAGASLAVPGVELVTAGRGQWFDDARQVVDTLHAGYGTRDVAATARTAGAHLRTLSSLGTTRVPARAAGGLLAAQAQVGALRGRALADVGDTHGAREALVTATGRATRARDWPVVAYAYALRGVLEVRAGDPDAALSAVTTGIRAAGDDPRLLLAAARAYAALGDVDQARSGLRAARRRLDAAGAPVVGPAAPGATSWSEFARTAVDVHVRTGNVAEAERLAGETVKAVPVELAADTELALGASVAVGLALTDVDRGADALGRALETSATMGRPARPVVERVLTFCGSVADPRQPAVRDLVELLEALDV